MGGWVGGWVGGCCGVVSRYLWPPFPMDALTAADAAAAVCVGNHQDGCVDDHHDQHRLWQQGLLRVHRHPAEQPDGRLFDAWPAQRVWHRAQRRQLHQVLGGRVDCGAMGKKTLCGGRGATSEMPPLPCRPGKKPFSSMSPLIAERGGDFYLSLGASGGPRIISAVLQTALRCGACEGGEGGRESVAVAMHRGSRAGRPRVTGFGRKPMVLRRLSAPVLYNRDAAACLPMRVRIRHTAGLWATARGCLQRWPIHVCTTSWCPTRCECSGASLPAAYMKGSPGAC